MTLEEAIRHCREVAQQSRCIGKRLSVSGVAAMVKEGADCEECAAEHEQLAEWLAELKQRREHEVNRAEILRLCNEIEDIACDIGNQTMNDIVHAEARMIFDKVKAIGKELTGDVGTD